MDILGDNTAEYLILQLNLWIICFVFFFLYYQKLYRTRLVDTSIEKNPGCSPENIKLAAWNWYRKKPQTLMCEECEEFKMDFHDSVPLSFAPDTPAASCWSPHFTHIVWFTWISTVHLALYQSCQPIRFRHLPLLFPQWERNKCHRAATGCPQWVLNLVYISTTLNLNFSQTLCSSKCFTISWLTSW